MRLLASLRLLLRDPAAWSAEHYARKNRMDLVALRPGEWRPLPREAPVSLHSGTREAPCER